MPEEPLVGASAANAEERVGAAEHDEVSCCMSPVSAQHHV